MHDNNWTGLPTLPELDAMPRFVHAPSTTATLNLAANAAQCARVWRAFDKAFTARCLAVAERAWRAAVANPDVAPPPDVPGGGGYGDSVFTDECYWAAAELFVTTGKQAYEAFLRGSPHLKAANFTPDGYSWQYVAPQGDLTLALLPNRLPGPDRAAVRQRLVEGADTYVAALRSQGYAVPYLPAGRRYVWGSNSQVLNNAIVIAAAYDLTRRPAYRDAAIETLDYILGRNGLNQSYVTGYGEHAAENQHHRFWANQIDPDLPNPPAGSMAGGPNAFLQDPVAARLLPGCASHKCYIDDIESFSTNEVTINWNAPLAWLTAWAAERAGERRRDHG
jgi:endoglucanase